jgi:hypothetical protein
MTPFDPMPPNPDNSQQTKGQSPSSVAAPGLENKSGKMIPSPHLPVQPAAAPPRRERAVSGLQPPGEPDPTRYIYGPDAAVFDAPPPRNPEPPEAEDEVGATLTGRQLAFCECYVERPVAARAARAAGYAKATADKQASRLLKHPLIMRRILELRRKRQLEQAYRRETLLDKFDVVFAAAIERNEFYAAVQALTMQARLAHIEEAMPGYRHVRRFESGPEQLIWDAVARLEQKLTEIAVGDFPGAAAAVPATSFEAGAVAEARKAQGWGSAEQRAADAVRRARRK